MFVEISSGAATVREATDLKRLSVRIEQGVALTPGLHGLGEPDSGGEHAWLQIDALKAAAAATLATLPATEQADWATGFDGMIAYAASKGWTSDDGRSVRAHVER